MEQRNNRFRSGVRALITGSSRGIGAAIAEELSACGFPVVLNFRSDREGAESVRAKIEDRGGEAALAAFDVADGEGARSAIEKLLQDDDRPIGIVVNNAGMHSDGPFPQLNYEQWTQVTRSTLDGFYHVTQPLVMPMVRQKWGRIINMSSISGIVGNRGQSNYSAAKAGIIGATKSLSQELAKRRITVNAIAPGIIETDMIKDLPHEQVMKMIPMRRYGKPEEVAKLVAFLVSEDAAYISGQTISINGGMV